MFHALAQPTRRAMLDELARGDRTVTELAAPFDVSLAAISKHIRVLEDANLVRQSKVGRTRRCSLRREPFDQMTKVLQHYQSFWEGALGNLDQMLGKRTKARSKK
jgi:DNA-binding transcriptional ArsR family regulator